MAMQTQSILASPTFGVANGSRITRMVAPSSGVMARFQKQVGLQVRCNANKRSEGEFPKAEPKASTSFGDVFAFSGPAPERINGRLAMIGFVAALAVELSKGTDLFSQISEGGAPWFIGSTILLSVASVVPLFKGERTESKTQGLMNANAELLNGRLAMLGLVALAITEYVKGSALV